ncbi:MAG: DMT family transporter [Rhodospirillaceae bacterium]|jgi:drug/metabolite transporter (DMT)-like permease|nr:DMT family transporter [Rhodospirillaceae bacterium]MBT5945051.1 DMT family transporter [Rhodospirillaceae bacterium]MBT6402868.1 DMT family transporter [Rhodospirillaceae bacterium]MBT6535760.1 DMT family transporter [Rhodospirillaceae bacterium]MBT7360759.1 DMT family transporter [Rhodospirillaceae bacterium]
MTEPGDRMFGLPRNMIAILAMVTGAACLAGNHALVRSVADEVGALETSALRFLWAVPLMLPWLIRSRGRMLHTRRHGLHFLAGVTTVASTLFLFSGLALLPLAFATSLSFTAPLFATVMAVLLLKERVSMARWITIAVGFAGVLIILRPGVAPVSPVSMLPLGFAIAYAFWFILMKRLGATELKTTTTFYQTVWSALLLTLIALPEWQWPSWDATWRSAAMAGLGTSAIFLVAWAFDLAEASLIAPFDYIRLPLITLIAYLAFAEVPDIFTVVGALIIVGATLASARLGARQAKPG